ERHLRHVLLSYEHYYNATRTHLSLNKDAPVPRGVEWEYRLPTDPGRTAPSILPDLIYGRHREEKLAVCRRGGRKRAIGNRAPMTVPMAPNERWSLDFVMDTLVSGRRFRILTLVDDFTRECLGLVAHTSLTALRVVRELGHIIESRGCPRMIVSDNGTEFTS